MNTEYTLYNDFNTQTDTVMQDKIRRYKVLFIQTTKIQEGLLLV